MTREDIVSYRFRDGSFVQPDWNKRAVGMYDEMLGWILEKKNDKWESTDKASMMKWLTGAYHAIARLVEIQMDAQHWVDVASSEYAIQMLDEYKDKRADGKSEWLKDGKRKYVSAPMFLLSCSINFRDVIQQGMTSCQSCLKAERWMPT